MSRRDGEAAVYEGTGSTVGNGFILICVALRCCSFEAEQQSCKCEADLDGQINRLHLVRTRGIHCKRTRRQLRDVGPS